MTGISDGERTPPKTPTVPRNDPENTDNPMEQFQAGYVAGVEAAAAVALAWDGWERDGDRRCADEIRRLVAFTPCDRPYADCASCKGTGDVDGDPCSFCVWKRWAEDNRDHIKTVEELEAERADDPCSDSPRSE